MPLYDVSSTGPDSLARLYSKTLTADAASIDTGANGIPQIATNLRIEMLLRTTEAVVISTVLMRINGDSTANYDKQFIQALNTGVSGAASTGNTSWVAAVTGANAVSSMPAVVIVEIPFYTATTFYKSCRVFATAGGSAAADMFLQDFGGSFRSASAITQFSVTAGSGNLLTGSSVAIYGI